ncbi:MAG: hypothetical protein M3416_03000 [Acidobacteriota bacterium]|nr:hypothetical protein [Acidobacteriota bacterium]
MPGTESDSAPREVRQALNGEIARQGYRYEISFPRSNGNRRVRYDYDFSDHPLRDLYRLFILGDAEELAGGSINQRCRALKTLDEFMSGTATRDLNPETFIAFVHWLSEARKKDGGRRFAETSLSTLIHNTKAFYLSGLHQGRPGWSQRDLDAITTAANRALWGVKGRIAQQSIDKALSLETFSDLAKAVALEFGQCKQVWEARQRGERSSLYNLDARMMQRIDPNPFVVLSLLGAMRHGFRATELNSLTPSDIRVDEVNGQHDLYVHAPDKTDGYVPVDDSFLLSWRFCEAWSAEAREMVGRPGEEVFQDALFVYLPTNSYNTHPLMRFDTYLLNRSHLPYFFKKWFAYTVTDDGGSERPLLHADGDPTRPLKIDYRKIRNAFAVRFAERERNRVTTSRVLRHKNVHTSEKFYLHQTRLDHARKVQIALKVEARFLAMGLKNAVAAGVTPETLQRARDAGALTPHGICGTALDGQSCVRASDCLDCPHLMVLDGAATRFLEDRDRQLAMAEELETEGDLRGAENARSRAKLCEAHLLRLQHAYHRGANES